MARVDEIGLAGMQQTEVAQKLTLTVPIARFAGDDQRRLEMIPRLVETAEAVVDYPQIA